MVLGPERGEEGGRGGSWFPALACVIQANTRANLICVLRTVARLCRRGRTGRPGEEPILSDLILLIFKHPHN